MKRKSKRDGVAVHALVRLSTLDVENLELAIDYMTEAANCMSARGNKAMAWQHAFCKRLRNDILSNQRSSVQRTPARTV